MLMKKILYFNWIISNNYYKHIVQNFKRIKMKIILLDFCFNLTIIILFSWILLMKMTLMHLIINHIINIIVKNEKKITFISIKKKKY